MARIRTGLTAALLGALSAASLGAQTVIVTSPGVKTVSGPEQSDTPAYDTWLRDNVRDGSSVGISTNYARSGNGSVYMNGSIPNTSKADIEYYFGGSILSPFKLSSLTSAAYDYFRNSSSTSGAWLAPSLRILIDEDGNLATTNDQGALIFEPVYNGYPTSGSGVPTDTWVSNLIGGSTNLWWRQFGAGGGSFDFNNVTLADYQSMTGESTNGRMVSGNSLVIGLSSGIGSGWNGTYDGAVDNIAVHAGNNDVTFNFETRVTSTPEPASMGLLATGLVGIIGFSRRRRKTA